MQKGEFCILINFGKMCRRLMYVYIYIFKLSEGEIDEINMLFLRMCFNHVSRCPKIYYFLLFIFSEVN